MQATRIFALLLVLQLALLLSCSSTVPATVTIRPGAPIEPNAMIYLSARAQLERITRSLREAGVMLTTDFKESDYTLDVRVGKSRSTIACGASTTSPKS